MLKERIKAITKKGQLKNKNYPKCSSCILHNCDAGEVNHDIDKLGRSRCLFNCGCPRFIRF